MRRLLIDNHELVGRFVSERMGYNAAEWGRGKTIGLLDGSEIIAGVVYNHFSKYGCCAHIAGTDGKYWLTPNFLFAIFDYPFNACGLNRITGLVPKSNVKARRLDIHLGFEYEGEMKEALEGGESLLVFGLLKRNCKWISDDFSKRVYKRLAMASGSPSLALH